MTPRRARALEALLLALAPCACRAKAPAPAEAPREEAAPSRPAGVVALAHLGQPRATLDAVTTALGVRRPADLLLAASLGVDVAVMASVDAARPIDVAVLTGGPHGGYVFAMTPPGAGHARGALSSRYRFVHVGGLGDRLELKGDPGLSSGERRLPCALVRVPSTISSRVVCGSDETFLARAGRWVAYESTYHAGSRDDLEVTAENEGLRRDVSPALRAAMAGLRQRLSADASAARREHDGPPDYGDPERVIGYLDGFAREAASTLDAARSATLRAGVTAERTELTVELTLPATSTASLVADARDRGDAPVTHPLAAMLPADAVFLMGSRASAASRAATLRDLTGTFLRVLGDRVTAPDAARADADALFARAGDALAVSLARDAPDGVEAALVLSQTDDGAAARAALARLATAPWVRALRLGRPPTVAAIRDGVVVTMPATSAAPPATAAPAPVSLAMGVRNGALVAVLGRHAVATLDAAAARAGGGVPALLDGANASAAGAVDLGAIGLRNAAPARFSYGARREGGDVHATLRATLPTSAIALVQGAVE